MKNNSFMDHSEHLIHRSKPFSLFSRGFESLSRNDRKNSFSVIDTRIANDITYRSKIQSYITKVNRFISKVIQTIKSILTRKSNDKSLLIQAIDSIYTDYTDEWWMRGLSPAGKDRLIEVIVTCYGYNFSPIDLHETVESNKCFPDTLMEVERGFKSIVKEVEVDSNNMVEFKPVGVYSLRTVEDECLMLALSKLLLNKVHIGAMAPLRLTKLRDLMEDHYEYIAKLDRVKILVRIELLDYFYLTLLKGDILERIDSFLDDGLIKDLITQFLSLPIKREDGTLIEDSTTLVGVGELIRVILDLYYRQVFDPVLEATYPGIRYSRWYNEVFIAIDMNKNNQILSTGNIKRELMHNILNKNKLPGAIDAIHHLGNRYHLVCHNKERVVILQEDGSVHVSGFNDMDEW